MEISQAWNKKILDRIFKAKSPKHEKKEKYF